MKVDIGRVVSYEVSKISIISLRFYKVKDELFILVRYEWIDSQGTVINTNVKRYTRQQLVDVGTSNGQDLTGLVGALTSLIPVDGKNQSLHIVFKDNVVTFRGFSNIEVDGVKKWESKTYTTSELTNVGIDNDAFVELVRLFAVQLTI